MEAGQAESLAAYIYGVEAVDILVGAHCLDDGLLVDMRRQRQLHDEAVDVGVGIERVDERQQLGLGHVGLTAYHSGAEPACLACLYLIGDVGLAAAVVAHEDCCEVRRAAALGYDACHSGCDVCFYFG